MGWSVVATDLPSVVTSVLANNVSQNCRDLDISVTSLDWAVGEDCWPEETKEATRVPFNLIVTADTVYSASLVDPLLRTIHHFAASARKENIPSAVLLCLERRDPALVDSMLKDAKEKYNFSVRRITTKKIAKSMRHSGIIWGRDEWDGIEMWKMTLT